MLQFEPGTILTDPNTLRLGAEGLPDHKHLGANARRRGHWQAQRHHTAAEKVFWYEAFEPQVLMAIREAGAKTFPWKHVAISVQLTWPTRQRRDYDNVWAALKPMIDVLCIASKVTDNSLRLGVIEDDYWPLVQYATLNFTYRKGIEHTAVTIERKVV